jgi:hypothetical protein
MDPHKKQFRKLKRSVKRAGTKRRRQHLKRELAENPEDAPFSEFAFGSNSSATLNGLDADATRKRKGKASRQLERTGEP